MKTLKSFFSFVLASVLLCSCNEEAEHQSIRQQLLEPYFGLLLKNDFETAYKNYTSDFYKSHSDSKAYLNSYQNIIAKKGKLKNFSINKISTFWPVGGETKFNVEVSMLLDKEKYAVPVLYEVSKTKEGKYQINSGWFHSKYGIPDGFDGPF